MNIGSAPVFGFQGYLDHALARSGDCLDMLLNVSRLRPGLTLGGVVESAQDLDIRIEELAESELRCEVDTDQFGSDLQDAIARAAVLADELARRVSAQGGLFELVLCLDDAVVAKGHLQMLALRTRRR